MKKSRGKVVQFIAESLKEQVLEQQKNTYELLKDSSKYIVECQQTGIKTKNVPLYKLRNFKFDAGQPTNLATVHSWPLG
jgi:hypothetical protein